MNPILEWLEERTGLPGAVAHFFNEEIPGSAGWHQVFGSVAVFSFLVQVFTGILLSFNYAPTPGRSMEQRSLHHDRADRRPHDPRPAPLGREHHDHRGRGPYGPGLPLGCLQETT